MKITKLNKTSIGDNFCTVKVSPVNGCIMISKDGVLFDKSKVESYVKPLYEQTKRNKFIDILKNINVVNETICFLDNEKPYIYFGPNGLVEYYIKKYNNNSYLVKTELEENLIDKSNFRINREELFNIINPNENENVIYVDRLLNIMNQVVNVPIVSYSPLYALRTTNLYSSLFEYYLSTLNSEELLLETKKYELGNTDKMLKKIKK